MDSPEKNPSLLNGQTAHPTTESAVASAAAPELIGLVTHEDVDRARDRWEVARARWKGRFKKFGGFRLLWLLVGPGVLVFLGENDAPSMLSYSADGSRYGVGFFIPFVVLTFVMGFIVQEMTVRLGAVTHRGHAELIFDRFGKFWGFFSMGDLVLGNFLTLVTEFIGVRAGLGFFGMRPAGRRGRRARHRRRRHHHRPLLDLGTNHAQPRNLQRAFYSRGDSGAARLACRRPRNGHLDAVPRRQPLRNSPADSGDHRRHRHSLDAFLPAERGGG